MRTLAPMLKRLLLGAALVVGGLFALLELSSWNANSAMLEGTPQRLMDAREVIKRRVSKLEGPKSVMVGTAYRDDKAFGSRLSVDITLDDRGDAEALMDPILRIVDEEALGADRDRSIVIFVSAPCLENSLLEGIGTGECEWHQDFPSVNDRAAH